MHTDTRQPGDGGPARSSRAPAVLALEFTGLSADQKFDRLLRDVESVRLDPLTADPAGSLDLPALAVRVRDRLPAGPPDVLLAYCTAAPLALHLAAACQERFGTWPHTVLFDPDPGSPAYLRAEFAVLCGNLGADPEAAAARTENLTGTRLLQALHGELLALRAGLVELYGGDSDAEELVEHLLTRYRGWLSFLAAGPAAGPVRAGGAVSVITGRAATGLEALVTDPAAVTVHRCDPAGRPLLVSDAADTALRAVLADGG